MVASKARFAKLAKLDLSCTDVDLSIFSNPLLSDPLSNSLTHLILNGCMNVDGGSLYHLKSLKKLKALDLSHCELVDDAGLELLSFYVPWLTHLNLSYLFRVTEKGVARIFRMPGVIGVNLMGCYRIKSYPWALNDSVPRTALPIRELLLGEDSRIQTRGFWLLWCTFAFSTTRLVSLCPFLETLRLNMVLFDLPANGLQTLLRGCGHLRNLSLVVDRSAVPALVEVSSILKNLDSLETTIHIGVTKEMIKNLTESGCLDKLKAIKFHSKHTTVFSNEGLALLCTAATGLEYLELNGDKITPSGLSPVPDKIPALQSLLVHHVAVDSKTMRQLAAGCRELKELTITDLQQTAYSNRISHVVGCGLAGPLSKIKKLELSSFAGFCDKDLALIPLQSNRPTLTAAAPHAANDDIITTSSNPRQSTSDSALKSRRPPPPLSGFHASSQECRALYHMALQGCRRLRVLDLTGDLGLTDWTLQNLGFLPSLHTVFLDSIKGITIKGVGEFARRKERQLKRVQVRNCRNCQGVEGLEDVEGLRVEIVVNGGRVLGRRWEEDA
ncbi:hypothetical protein HDU88_006067 [Geranomyces variabilis]|nr:hypothetical protein HDU88_006067 [Geranomyces variabilis]